MLLIEILHQPMHFVVNPAIFWIVTSRVVSRISAIGSRDLVSVILEDCSLSLPPRNSWLKVVQSRDGRHDSWKHVVFQRNDLLWWQRRLFLADLAVSKFQCSHMNELIHILWMLFWCHFGHGCACVCVCSALISSGRVSVFSIFGRLFCLTGWNILKLEAFFTTRQLFFITGAFRLTDATCWSSYVPHCDLSAWVWHIDDI